MSAAGSRIVLARHYLAIDQPARALQALDAATSDDLASADFFLARGQTLYQLDRYADAIDAARAGLALDAELVPLLTLLGLCEAERGDLPAAERALLAALERAPDSAPLIARYALLVGQAGQFAKAERLLGEASRRDPGDPDVARCRTLLAYLRGDDRGMDRAGRAALAQSPDDAYAHHLLGVALLNRGLVGDAERRLSAAAQANPNEQAFAEPARDARVAAHWLLWPLRPLRRIGAIPFWLGCLACFFALNAAGLRPAAAVLAIVYFVFVVYSWAAPPLLRWWYRARRP